MVAFLGDATLEVLGLLFAINSQTSGLQITSARYVLVLHGGSNLVYAVAIHFLITFILSSCF